MTGKEREYAQKKIHKNHLNILRGLLTHYSFNSIHRRRHHE